MNAKSNNESHFPAFTLLELTVSTCVVLLLASALVIGRAKAARNDTFIHAASGQIVKACELARADSERSGQACLLRFDAFQHRLVIERELSDQATKVTHAFQMVPEVCWAFSLARNSEARPQSSGEAYQPTETDEVITFHPDGTADNRNIRLVDCNGSELLVRIDRDDEHAGRIKPLPE